MRKRREKGGGERKKGKVRTGERHRRLGREKRQGEGDEGKGR
jgi:hypothetical protein